MVVRQTDLVVELAVHTFPFGIDQFEGVGAVAIHVTVAIRQPSITEQERHLQTDRLYKKRICSKFSNRILITIITFKNSQDNKLVCLSIETQICVKVSRFIIHTS